MIEDTAQIVPPRSRNDPCPCGSGKRYKNCHGAIAATPASVAPNDAITLMHRALAAQQGGRLADARVLYDQALAIEPDQVDALHMRGVVALMEGQHETAIQFIEAAIAKGLDNNNTRYNLSLAVEAIRARIGAQLLRDAARIEHAATDRFIAPTDVQLLAYYLPQFHEIPENNRWWGEGFTEWTNVRRAQPNFDGHDQPRVPSELGYYNLLDANVRAQQAALAKQYGITGFCYYHYWFKGKRLLETPLEQVLKSKQPDFPFCVFWANENWSKRWDGGNNELLIEQAHDADDDVAFIEHLLPYFADSRYIRINGRPLLMIYRIEQFANARETIARWAKVCRAHGEAAPYVVKADTRLSEPPHIYGADASVEFPPHRLAATSLFVHDAPGLRRDYQGTLIDFPSAAASLATAAEPAHTHFRTVMPGWDNSARKQLDGSIFLNSNPDLFRAWLRDTFARAEAMLPPGRRFVFVNAWNEWAEGAYLEPDQRHGRAMLEAALAARYIPAQWRSVNDALRDAVKRLGERPPTTAPQTTR
jgi:lipopolysaccharide biosynthesis protein